MPKPWHPELISNAVTAPSFPVSRSVAKRKRFFDKLCIIIQESKEIVVASTVASRNNAFKRLGLTDAALLEVTTAETPLVTVDLDLYLAALAKRQDTAVNFTHLQDL